MNSDKLPPGKYEQETPRKLPNDTILDSIYVGYQFFGYNTSSYSLIFMHSSAILIDHWNEKSIPVRLCNSPEQEKPSGLDLQEGNHRSAM